MRNSILYMLGTICYAILQWIILVYISNIYGASYAGHYTLYLSFLTPVVILLNGGLRVYLSSDVLKENSDESYLILRYCFLVLYFVLLLPFLYFSENPSAFAFCYFLKGFDSLSDLEYGAWNRSKLIKNYFSSQLLRMVSFVSFLYFLIYFDLNDFYYFSPLSLLVVYFFYDRRNSSLTFLIRNVDIIKIRLLLSKSYKIGVSALLAALSVTVTRTLINYYIGAEGVAEFVYITYFYNVASIAVLAISQISIPIFSESINIFKTKHFKGGLFFISVFSIFYLLFVLIMSNIFISTFYDVSFYYELNVRCYVGFSGMFLFLGVFINVILIARKKVKELFRINLILFVFNLFASWTLISINGILGAYESFLINAFTLLMLNAFFVIKSERQHIFS
ncbi:TPA: lipopolysaccharide biosynthesis protein [Vibrio alginolyticus]